MKPRQFALAAVGGLAIQACARTVACAYFPNQLGFLVWFVYRGHALGMEGLGLPRSFNEAPHNGSL
jgi:hypothetical protein